MTEPHKADVIVLGAGIAGLSAADHLTKTSRSVIVLEARERLGGRVFSKPVNRQPFDFGAQWLGPNHAHAHALVQQLGLKIAPPFTTGRKMYENNGAIVQHNGSLAQLPLLSSLALRATIGKIDKCVKEIKGDGDAESELLRNKRAYFDAFSWADWCDDNIKDSAARRALACLTRAIFAAEPAEISLYHALRHYEASGGFSRLAQSVHGTKNAVIIGGAQQLAVRLAQRVQQQGGQIRLNSLAKSVLQSESTVAIKLADGELFEGRRLIAAIPPVLVSALHFEPAASPRAQKLRETMPQGAQMKFVVCFDTPFWRKNGLSGAWLSNDSPIHMMMDESPTDGQFGALAGYFLGHSARQAHDRGRDATQAMIGRELLRIFGKAASQPLALDLHDWLDEPFGGAGGGIFPQGAISTPPPVIINQVQQDPMWDAYAVLRAPQGLTHFAGTETAKMNIGSIEGAIESGQRAANEVLAALG